MEREWLLGASKEFLKTHTSVGCLFAVRGKPNVPHWNAVSTYLLLFYLTILWGWTPFGVCWKPKSPTLLLKTDSCVEKINLELQPPSSQFIHHIHPPLFVSPSIYSLYKPTRKWQRKCARDQFFFFHFAVEQLSNMSPLLAAASQQSNNMWLAW